MCLFSSRPKPKLVDIFLSFVVQLLHFSQLLFNYSSTITFLSNIATFSHLLFNCYISFICCSPALPFLQPLANHFLLLQSLEGNNLEVQHPCAYYITHACNLAYCWTHFVHPRFTPMYLRISVWRPIWKSWWKQSPIWITIVGVQATMNHVLAHFLIVFQVAYSIVEPNLCCLFSSFVFLFLSFTCFHFLYNCIFHCFSP